MADVVLTVAKSLVEGTLTKAQLAIEEEEKLRKRAQRDLVFITGEFQMMRSFLSVTTKEHVQNKIVSTCVTQVRDLAYDVEDCIEFILHLNTKSDWWCRLIPSCIAPARPLDEAVDILEHLKARVQDLSDRNTRYKLIGDNSTPRTPGEMGMPAAANASDLRQQDIDALAKLIAKRGKDLQVIWVWASKDDSPVVSIIRKAYNNPKICREFLSAWVKIEKHLDLSEVLRRLIQEFHQNSSETLEEQTGCATPKMGSNKKVEEVIRNLLEPRKYCIVLEGVSTKEEWEKIKRCFLDCRKGSRVVVLTNRFQLPNECTEYPYIPRFWSDYTHCVFYNEIPLVGRQVEMKKLIDFQTPEDDLLVISIWGAGGAGKSALARRLYHDKISNRKKDELFIWVDMSHSWDPKKLWQSLRLQLASHSLPPSNGTSSGEEIKDFMGECKGLLNNRRCFLVFDNLHYTEQWDNVRELLVSLSNGSTIIITTSQERVALHCAGKRGFILNVRGLEFAEAIDLFKEQVRKHRNNHLENAEEIDDIRKLICKCSGLPEVIIAVADYLGEEFHWQKKAKSLLQGKLVNKLETMSEFTCLRGLLGWMQTFLGSLPEDLKHHIAYLLIFPGDRSIRRRRLLTRWVAERFSKDTDSYTANENGEMFFTKLIELSMIHPPLITSTNTRIVSYAISNIFHEYMVTRPQEENIATAIEIFKLKESCSPTSERRGRHLVIEESWDRDRIVYENIDFSRLRSLTVFGKWDSFFITESMKVLRVLDLEDAEGVKDEDLRKMLKQLRRLKFLSLRRCTDISSLPDSVGELRQLEILDVRHTNIVTLPRSITKLKKLQYIRAGTSALSENLSTPSIPLFNLGVVRRCLKLVGVEVASGFANLTALHTLGVVHVGSISGKIILNELGNLTQLRRLGVSGIRKKNYEEFYSAILCHSRLESLSVWLRKGNQKYLVAMSAENAEKASKALKKLERLKLYGLLEKMPNWIGKLNNLKRLNLEMDVLSEDNIKVLGSLPELCILRLRVHPPVNQDGKVSFLVVATDTEVQDFCYKKLKVLEIASRAKLHLIIGSRAMQNLEVLWAGCLTYGSLGLFPVLKDPDLKDLSKLKEVCVIGPHDDKLKEFLGGQFNDRTNKPILKVNGVILPVQEITGGNANNEAAAIRSNQTPSSSTGNGQTMVSNEGKDKAQALHVGQHRAKLSTEGNDQIPTSKGGDDRTKAAAAREITKQKDLVKETGWTAHFPFFPQLHPVDTESNKSAT